MCPCGKQEVLLGVHHWYLSIRGSQKQGFGECDKHVVCGTRDTDGVIWEWSSVSVAHCSVVCHQSSTAETRWWNIQPPADPQQSSSSPYNTAQLRIPFTFLNSTSNMNFWIHFYKIYLFIFLLLIKKYFF